MLNVIDDECLAIRIDRRLRATDVMDASGLRARARRQAVCAHLKPAKAATLPLAQTPPPN